MGSYSHDYSIWCLYLGSLISGNYHVTASRVRSEPFHNNCPFADSEALSAVFTAAIKAIEVAAVYGGAIPYTKSSPFW